MIFAHSTKVQGQVVFASREASPANADTNTYPEGMFVERRPDGQWAVLEDGSVLVIRETEQAAELWAVAELERRAPAKGHSGAYGLGKEDPLWWR